jgi:glycosyltransferase involved in cell wall biosynthesis
MLKKLYRMVKRRMSPPSTYPVILRPSFGKRPIGRVLLSYLEHMLYLPENSSQYVGHSSFWESRAIAGIFLKLGYQVEAIRWNDMEFLPTGKYDIVFDIFANLGRINPLLDKDTIKLLHCTGSDPFYQNAAEQKRVAELKQRRTGNYTAKRTVAHPELTYLSLEAADACSLLGNEHTRETYPEKFRQKMELVTVSASLLNRQEKRIRRSIPAKRDFLWFFGTGAVHKGLDLLLEVFASHPELQLHIVGHISAEEDFCKIYEKELTATENIHAHGCMVPSAAEFQVLLRDVFCFVAPSCSEGISPSVVTCLQMGLYPILSRDTGVTLPEHCGLYMEKLTVDEVEKCILSTREMKDEEILHQVQQTQRQALSSYSRDAFKVKMEDFILCHSGKTKRIRS